MKKFSIVFTTFVFCSILLLSGCSGKKDSYLVKYEDNAEVEKIESMIKNHGGTNIEHLNDLQIFRVELAGEDAKALEEEPGIEYVEKDSDVKTQ